jgi:hypothetical protein
MNGLLTFYDYIAPASGILNLTIETASGASWHFYGFSNEMSVSAPGFFGGDYNQSGRVDWDDFAIFGSFWLSSTAPLFDNDDSGSVDMADFKLFVANWLTNPNP